jgi:hypothetical protein
MNSNRSEGSIVRPRSLNDVLVAELKVNLSELLLHGTNGDTALGVDLLLLVALLMKEARIGFSVSIEETIFILESEFLKFRIFVVVGGGNEVIGRNGNVEAVDIRIDIG